MLVLSVLMVSRVRFRSFKDLRLSGKTVGVVLLLAGACTAIVFAGLKKAFIFLFLSVAYITLGLAEEIIFFRSRRQAARDAARETSAPNEPAAPQAPREEEVLRELGAFDEAERERARARRLRARGGGRLALAVVHLDEDAVDHRQDRGQHQRHLHRGQVGRHPQGGGQLQLQRRPGTCWPASTGPRR